MLDQPPAAPLAVLTRAVRPHRRGRLRRARDGRRDGRARRSWRATFNAMAERAEPVPPQLAGRAAAGAAGLAGGHRQHAGSGGRLRRRAATCSTSTRPPRRCSGSARDRRSSLERAPTAVRAVLERVRGHVLAGKGAYVPQGFEEAVRDRRPPRASATSCRARHPVYGEDGAHRGRHGRPAGRDAPAPLRRAAQRPGGHRGARVPHAADLAAHGHPPLPRGKPPAR